MNESEPALSAEDRTTLLGLARQALVEYLSVGTLPGPGPDAPALREKRATFVTLRTRESGELRGCRGEYLPEVTLADSVVKNAIASATDDPRFPSVTVDEVSALSIEISVLTHPARIDPSEVIVGRHGLLLVQAQGSGLLLPQVASDRGWTREEFLVRLSSKAGLAEDAWRAADAKLFGFEAFVWGEE